MFLFLLFMAESRNVNICTNSFPIKGNVNTITQTLQSGYKSLAIGKIF